MSRRAYLNSDKRPLGKEKPNPTPVAATPPQKPPLPLREEIERFLPGLHKIAEDRELDTLEDENDYEPDEDFTDMVSQYTVVELRPEEQVQGESLDGEAPPAAQDGSGSKDEPADPIRAMVRDTLKKAGYSDQVISFLENVARAEEVIGESQVDAQSPAAVPGGGLENGN